MNTNKSKYGILFAAGMAAGYLISLIIPKEAQEKNRERMQKIKNILTDPEEQQRIKEIFKERTDEAMTTYHMTKDKLARNLSDIQQQVGSITRDKYIHAVQDAIDYVSEYQEIPTPQINALKKYLENDFNRIKSSLQIAV